ncbi:hypothetical protein ScPMuIL_011907 [Solemya velum]
MLSYSIAHRGTMPRKPRELSESVGIGCWLSIWNGTFTKYWLTADSVGLPPKGRPVDANLRFVGNMYEETDMRIM